MPPPRTFEWLLGLSGRGLLSTSNVTTGDDSAIVPRSRCSPDLVPSVQLMLVTPAASVVVVATSVAASLPLPAITDQFTPVLATGFPYWSVITLSTTSPSVALTLAVPPPPRCRSWLDGRSAFGGRDSTRLHSSQL